MCDTRGTETLRRAGLASPDPCLAATTALAPPHASAATTAATTAGPDLRPV